jgi:hypothetical protein
MIDVDTKQLARFEWVGHRINGDRRQGCSREVRATRRCMSPSTTPHAWPMLRCFQTSRRQRLSLPGSGCRLVQPAGHHLPAPLSDNRFANRLGAWRKACKTLGLRAIRTKPYMPRTNGKAERYGLRPTASTSSPLPAMDL